MVSLQKELTDSGNKCKLFLTKPVLQVKKMKKVLISFLFFLLISDIYAGSEHEFEKNRYSTELNCEDPATLTDIEYDVLMIDLERYKTIIRNGNIAALEDAIEHRYINDMQLGVLNKTELKILRNMVYAKKGYIFQDENLIKYFKNFSWYEPKTKEVSFSASEDRLLERIRFFEADSSYKYPYKGKNAAVEYWNGGADQTAPVLKLNKDTTFVFLFMEDSCRISRMEGKWGLVKNKIILKAETLNVYFGGWYQDDPVCTSLENATSAVITYKNPVKITLPLNIPKNDLAELDYLLIGSMYCRIKEQTK